MPNYIDGFVLPVPADKIDAYAAMSEKARKVWLDHGALDYRETVLDDPTAENLVAFPTLAGVKEGETVVFAFIVYESREQRDAVNAKVMSDPRMQEMCPSQTGGEMPFDCARMAYGGFRTIVGS